MKLGLEIGFGLRPAVPIDGPQHYIEKSAINLEQNADILMDEVESVLARSCAVSPFRN